jgi:hypothetical protein
LYTYPGFADGDSRNYTCRKVSGPEVGQQGKVARSDVEVLERLLLLPNQRDGLCFAK